MSQERHRLMVRDEPTKSLSCVRSYTRRGLSWRRRRRSWSLRANHSKLVWVEWRGFWKLYLLEIPNGRSCWRICDDGTRFPSLLVLSSKRRNYRGGVKTSTGKRSTAPARLSFFFLCNIKIPNFYLYNIFGFNLFQIFNIFALVIIYISNIFEIIIFYNIKI